MKGERRIRNTLTHDVDRVGWADNAIWIVIDDVGRLKNPLYGTGFDIELVVAKTVFPRSPTSSARC